MTDDSFYRRLFEKYAQRDEPRLKEFICPISQSLIRDPVLGAKSVVYEKRELTKWVKSTHGKRKWNNNRILKIVDPTIKVEFTLAGHRRFQEATHYREQLKNAMSSLEKEESLSEDAGK